MLTDPIAKWVLALDLRTHSKIVLLAMLAYASRDTLTCWPSQGRLASDTSLSERTVRTCLNELRTAGLIRLARAGCRGDGGGRGRRPNLYAINLPPMLQVADLGSTRQALPVGQGTTGKSAGATGKKRPDQPARGAGEVNHEDHHREVARAKAKLPWAPDALVDFARRAGLPEPRIGEATDAYRARLEVQYQRERS